MAATQTLTITLPDEIARAIKSRVDSGEFASEGDLLSESFQRTTEIERKDTLGMSDKDFELLLQEEVVPVLKEIDADPSQVVSAEEAFAHLKGTITNYKKQLG